MKPGAAYDFKGHVARFVKAREQGSPADEAAAATAVITIAPAKQAGQGRVEMLVAAAVAAAAIATLVAVRRR